MDLLGEHCRSDSQIELFSIKLVQVRDSSTIIGPL
jgi:hypothetical protein